MMKKKVLFFGTPSIAVPILERLSSLENIEVVGVGCPSDKKVGRKQLLTSCAVKECAISLGITVIEVNNKKEVIAAYEKFECDIVIVVAFGVLFPEEILNTPEFGTINIHFSLLPTLRGASPVQSSILEGRKESGITIQRMVKALDAGDVLWQKKWNIENKKTSELWEFFAEKTADDIPGFLDQYFSRKIQPKKQDENLATFCSKFTKSNGEVNPKTETAQAIWHKYLAFDVWPKVFISTDHGNIKLGKISRDFVENSYELPCAKKTTIFIEKAQIPGKKMMNISDIMRGNSEIFS